MSHIKTLCTCEITLTPGIIDAQAPEKIISVLNCGDQHVTIYPNMKLGTCESLYEQEPIKQEMCARINVPNRLSDWEGYSCINFMLN
jgi:hypothetical protein